MCLAVWKVVWEFAGLERWVEKVGGRWRNGLVGFDGGDSPWTIGSEGNRREGVFEGGDGGAFGAFGAFGAGLVK